jgi:hypothetical protein
MQIEQFAVWFNDLKAMGKAFGDDHHARIGRCQFFRMPLQESWRALAQIYGNIPNAPFDAAHQFHLGMRRILKMQAPYCTHGSGSRMIDLNDWPMANHLSKFLCTIKPSESAANICL